MWLCFPLSSFPMLRHLKSRNPLTISVTRAREGSHLTHSRTWTAGTSRSLWPGTNHTGEHSMLPGTSQQQTTPPATLASFSRTTHQPAPLIHMKGRFRHEKDTLITQRQLCCNAATSSTISLIINPGIFEYVVLANINRGVHTGGGVVLDLFNDWGVAHACRVFIFVVPCLLLSFFFSFVICLCKIGNEKERMIFFPMLLVYAHFPTSPG